MDEVIEVFGALFAVAVVVGLGIWALSTCEKTESFTLINPAFAGVSVSSDTKLTISFDTDKGQMSMTFSPVNTIQIRAALNGDYPTNPVVEEPIEDDSATEEFVEEDAPAGDEGEEVKPVPWNERKLE